MTIGSLVPQLLVRLCVIATLLGTVGVMSYSATHWYPSTGGGETSATAPANR